MDIQYTHEEAERILTNPNQAEGILWFSYSGTRYGYVFDVDSIVDYTCKRLGYSEDINQIMLALHALRVRIMTWLL